MKEGGKENTNFSYRILIKELVAIFWGADSHFSGMYRNYHFNFVGVRELFILYKNANLLPEVHSERTISIELKRVN
jgi:hypothetical protein